MLPPEAQALERSAASTDLQRPAPRQPSTAHELTPHRPSRHYQPHPTRRSVHPIAPSAGAHATPELHGQQAPRALPRTLEGAPQPLFLRPQYSQASPRPRRYFAPHARYAQWLQFFRRHPATASQESGALVQKRSWPMDRRLVRLKASPRPSLRLSFFRHHLLRCLPCAAGRQPLQTHRFPQALSLRMLEPLRAGLWLSPDRIPDRDGPPQGCV